VDRGRGRRVNLRVRSPFIASSHGTTVDMSSLPEQSVWWLMACRSFHSENRHTGFASAAQGSDCPPRLRARSNAQKDFCTKKYTSHSKSRIF
jgi:hypothetical protein